MGCLPKQLNNWENAQNMPGVAWLAVWADALGYEVALLPKAAEPTNGWKPMTYAELLASLESHKTTGNLHRGIEHARDCWCATSVGSPNNDTQEAAR